MKLSLQRTISIALVFGLLAFASSCSSMAHSDYRIIHQLVINGDLAGTIQDLNSYPGDINLQDDVGQTPLHLAAIHCRTNIVALLVKRGAKVDATAKGGATPLHLAAQAGCKDAIVQLIACGADINARDANSRTPLARAEDWNQSEAADYLKAHGGHR